MTHILKGHGRRRGFTLIELLVVIAIIGVLIGLTAAAVFKLIGKGPEVQCSTEIGQLAVAIGAFKQEFNVSYMPSRLRLRENGQYNDNDLLDRRTQAFLQTMFGKRFNPRGAYDWNNNGVPNETLDLEGHACLVFLLGGIPTRSGLPGCYGFSTTHLNPVDVTAAGVPTTPSRRGPLFEFKSTRLVRNTPATPIGGTGPNMFVYLDPFGKKPYAYMSSSKASNDYTPDGKSLGVTPYLQAPGRFMEPNGFQIISAGPDGLFGPGTGWNPSVGYNNSGPGADDRANFSRLRLGAGVQ